MFWTSNNNSTSEIDALLGKQDVTLQEVLDAENIISFCKVQNKALIDFLLRPEKIKELVSLTIKEPSLEIDECIRFKYPNIACELLLSNVPAINERLASEKELLDELYSFLECEPPLNPLLASYFSRIMGALIAKKTEQNLDILDWNDETYNIDIDKVLDFLKAKDTFISLLLKHLGTSAIMDLMLKLITQVESSEMRQNILNWLDSQQIMQSLVTMLNPKIDKERHYNVAQLLCDFIRIARDTQRHSTERVDPDPLLNTLESSETVTLLLDNIFDEERCDSAIIGGIQVLLALLDVNQFSIPKINSHTAYNSNINDEATDIVHRENVVQSTTLSILPRLKDFHDILLNPPKKSPVITTVGTLDPPLGNTRLQVTRLFAAVISSNNKKCLNEIIALGTFPVLIDLFFNYTWNNFLHTQVENCLVSALMLHSSDEEETEEHSNALTRHVLVNCSVIERILSAWKDNDEQQKESKGVRKGYMGHLITLVNKIVELCSETSLGQYIKVNLPEVSKSLEEFKDSTLEETNALRNILLGGAYPNSSNDGNDDYGDVAFPQEQIYSNYQQQHLTSHCIEGYSGFNDDAFNDGDDTLQSIDHRTDMNFSLSDGDSIQQAELFKQICAQSINTLDDADDQIFEDRDHTLQTVIEKGDRDETVYSSDSDDDSPPVVISMDVDPWSSPKAAHIAPLSTADPWGAASEGPVTDWADFSSASFEADFRASLEKTSADIANITDIKHVVENDLNVENIEIEPKVNLSESPKDMETNETTTTTTITTTTTCNNSIEETAQEKKTEIKQPSKDIAAGDQCDDNNISKRDDDNAKTASEPSNSPNITDGDSCAVPHKIAASPEKPIV